MTIAAAAPTSSITPEGAMNGVRSLRPRLAAFNGSATVVPIPGRLVGYARAALRRPRARGGLGGLRPRRAALGGRAPLRLPRRGRPRLRPLRGRPLARGAPRPRRRPGDPRLGPGGELVHAAAGEGDGRLAVGQRVPA